MANKEHVERLKRSVKEWNEWRQEHPEIQPDLSGADLKGANMSNANLNGADLAKASLNWSNLNGANLSTANLFGANLSEADLTEADLTNTDLNGTHLSLANLREAHLCNADLGSAYNPVGEYVVGAIFVGTKLVGTDFTQSHFYDTIFARVNLSLVRGLEAAVHDGPSNVDINSVTLPHDETTRLHFLRGVGFSDAFIEYLPSLLTLAIQYHSLFIAYAHQDEILARRLHQDLQNKGVRCWMAPHDLRPGDYHHSRIDEAIHLHEKVLLLLSEHAVNSSWVKHEVQVALAREIQQDCMVLFPLRLDEAVMHTTKDWATRLRESRHIGDFTSWQEDTAYQVAFSRLLRDLKVSRPPTG